MYTHTDNMNTNCLNNVKLTVMLLSICTFLVLHYFWGTIYRYIPSVEILKEVPLSIWNKALPDCELGETPGKLILLQGNNSSQSIWSLLQLVGISLFVIIIQLSRFKITCLTDFFTVNVIILINILYW